MVKLGVVIPAAGQGKRMGASINKQLLPLQGRPVLAHTLALFDQSEYVAEIVVVSSRVDWERISDLVRGEGFQKVSSIVLGGAERQESVFAGVKALCPLIQRVAVHDGARPLLTCTELNRFFTEAEKFGAAIMAIPVKDTIKRVDAQGKVLETPPRETLRAIQTPQVFERALLEEAHQKASELGYLTTDDAALIEWLGYPVQTLMGSHENIKITTPEDLDLAENILNNRDRSQFSKKVNKRIK